MKMKSKKIQFWEIILIVWMLGSITVSASEKIVPLEYFTGTDSVSVYIDGIEDIEKNTTVQIGTNMAESVTVHSLDEQSIPMKTLIMLDNSLSISKEDRKKIASFMQDIISDRMAGEQIAIATFSENITYLTEYTDDYTAMKNAVDGIEYLNQETYLTDVLYELLSTEYIAKSENIFRRIIVISDGVDNKSLGYTKDELINLLEDNTIPIYTVGCSTGKNNEQLENMFALSRKTSAESFLISDIDNTLEINSVLNQDRTISKVEIIPMAADMDGTKKAVKITVNEAAEPIEVTMEIRMPQKQIEIIEPTVEESVDEIVEEIVKEPEEEINAEVVKESKLNVKLIVVVMCIILAISVIGGVILVVFLKKNRKVEFESIDDSMLSDLALNVPDQKTELIHTYMEEDDDKTCMIWNEQESYHVLLTDIESPMRSFQIPLNQSVIIGRKQGVCGIVIDYDKSVSGRHCQISVRNGRFYIVDLQSSNGTYVNENKVLSEVEIYSGSIIKLGRLQLKFEIR